jgi:hypothetical protein
VVHISPFPARRCAAFFPQLAVYRDKIDERLPGSELEQAEFFTLAFDPASQNIAVEPCHAWQIPDPQHDVIEAEDLEH